MGQSPELAGGEGFTYEGYAAAFYLAAVLDEGYGPGIDGMRVVCVSVQQRDFGEPLDDLIVDFEDLSRNRARLSLQVKRTLTVSSARSNADFREIIRDCWATLKKPDFRIAIDRYGVAVGTISSMKEHALKTLCDWARESLTPHHFDHRFSPTGSASEEMKSMRREIVSLLEEVGKGSGCTSEEIHQFFAHFVLIRFDFLREGATHSPEAINRIKECLNPEDAAQAPLVWARLIQLVRASSGKSGQFDRSRLLHQTSHVARFRSAMSLRNDLDKIAELAHSYANLIPDDVAGIKLERDELLQSLKDKLTSARLVQVKGMPGSGKSVLVRRLLQSGLEHGPVLFLKAEQIEGTSWISYATSNGLSGAPLEKLLLEIGTTGTPILFIDAIDRIEKEHQPVIIDLFRAILDSPFLEDWRIVVSLRDTGIEVLRNWLGPCLDRLTLASVEVKQLRDEDAKMLATAKPHLHPLLFGTPQIREIVRRPFFAKILHQCYAADSDAPIPMLSSEVDLIEHWWKRGGYNESGQPAIGRQRTLVELSRLRAGQLNQPILLSQLSSIVHIEALKLDGILQDARPGISVRFAHDIFFEWAIFYALADRGEQWIEEIKSCGEPPAVARVVELSSQWEYDRGSLWQTNLKAVERPEIRSQWLRAWLVGPLGSSKFEMDSDQFCRAAFADDYRLFQKTLVWFQAEKTTPNPNITSGDFPADQRQRFADLLGWPSDFGVWRRLIQFILSRISDIPVRLYPEIVAIFEVWQNALASLRNPISTAFLQHCATWLTSIDLETGLDRLARGKRTIETIWVQIPDLKAFRASMVQLLLRSTQSEPALVAAYLSQLAASKDFRDEPFVEILPFSSSLAQTMPKSLVDLSLAYFCEELPEDRITRKAEERRIKAEWRKSIRNKPKAERTEQEERSLSFSQSLHNDDVPYKAWENLSIRDGLQNFWPPSPLREPFHSLFRLAPREALRLLRSLCNHAMETWRQLHRVSHERKGTPIPLELTFPWGNQQFWGSEREYGWCRSTCAPKILGCAFMSLDDWCFAELDRGIPIEEIYQSILEGNECIAVLGTAAMLALHTASVSETTLPLFTSQRILAADDERWKEDFSTTASLIGFEYPKDKNHIEAVKSIDARAVRKQRLSWMVPNFIFSSGTFSEQMRAALLGFEKNLPFQYQEHIDHPEAQEHFLAQARKYAEMAHNENYQALKVEDDPSKIAIVHVSPSATTPENVAKAQEARARLLDGDIWAWVSKCFEQKVICDSYTIEKAVEMAKVSDMEALFAGSTVEIEEDQFGMRRGAVAGTAAVVLAFREGIPLKELEWAREVLTRVTRSPEKGGRFWFPEVSIPWHPCIYAARGVAADIRHGTAARSAVQDLLNLIAHPLEGVAKVALAEACALWNADQKLTWAALHLALSLCHIPPIPKEKMRPFGQPHHTPKQAKKAVGSAFAWYVKPLSWKSLPLPPLAWIKVQRKGPRRPRSYDDYYPDDLVDPEQEWAHPETIWHSKQAAQVLKQIPFEAIFQSDAKESLLDFLADILQWTSDRLMPPWVKRHRHNRRDTQILEWTYALANLLGDIAGLLPLGEFRPRFLDRILSLEGEACWDMLDPFTRSVVCRFVYDAPSIPPDTFELLDLCLTRLLSDSVFTCSPYNDGRFFGWHLPEVVRTLLFVSVERAELAARYVNGDWSEINLILPLVDRLVCAGGWTAFVMGNFLTLVERAKAYYPSEAFANQILHVLANGEQQVKGWHGTFLSSRIAEMIQFFAHRDNPLPHALAQKFLRVLDMLVDMGDRRSAALQLSESFRSVRLA